MECDAPERCRPALLHGPRDATEKVLSLCHDEAQDARNIRHHWRHLESRYYLGVAVPNQKVATIRSVHRSGLATSSTVAAFDRWFVFFAELTVNPLHVIASSLGTRLLTPREGAKVRSNLGLLRVLTPRASKPNGAFCASAASPFNFKGVKRTGVTPYCGTSRRQPCAAHLIVRARSARHSRTK